jgi:Xaa-Pro aminopeptidase
MLEHLELVDATGYIQETRMVKSLYEIEYMKESARLASETFNNIPNLIKEGMTELDLACKIALFLTERGSQVNLRIRAFNQEPSLHVLSGWSAAYPGSFNGPTVGTGLNSCYPQGAGYKKIGRNEPILIDFATVLNGYAVDHTRIFSIGQLSDKLDDAYNTTLKIKHRLIKETKPGCDGKKLYDIALSMAKESGYAAHFMGYGNGVNFIGHGIGLELDEWPVIAKKINIVLQQGMVFALEPKFVFPGEGAVGIEDTFFVNENGLEQLTGFDDSIQVL